MDETKRAADELATKGFIDSGRRRNLYGLKQQYNQNVVPLQNQLKIRQERAEELRRMQLQDPTFRSTLNPNEVGLTSGLKNPEAFNYSGVSGNQMYKSVAEKASQLSKVIEQEHPELIKSKLAYNYFTAVQSGASLKQVDAAMRRQFNPKDVDKMTNLMRGVVESTFNEFGVPQKFANNQQVQDELWQTASQGLYAALGSKQFGTMHDSWGEAIATKKLNETPPEPPGKTHMEYDASFDEKNFKELNNLLNSANNVLDGKVTISDPKYTTPNSTGSAQYRYYEDKDKKSQNESQKEIFKLAKDLERKGLIKVPKKIATKDLPKWNKSIIELAKEDFKTANLSRHYFNPSEETSKKLTSAVSQMDRIVDINGKEVKRDKIFSTSGKLIGDAYLVRGNNGTTLKTVDKEGNQISIPFDIAKLGSTKLRDYDAQVQQIKSNMKSMSPKQLKDYYGNIDPIEEIENYEDAIDNILTSEQYTQTKSQDTNPGYSGYGE